MTDDDDINCDSALVALYQFLDGELTVERRSRIELHLDGCPHCFSAYDFHEELRIVVRTRLQRQVPPDLVQRISLAIAAEGGPFGPGGSTGPSGPSFPPGPFPQV